MENINDGKNDCGRIETITVDGIASMNMINMAHKDILLFVGPNGTGKTLVLVLVWVITMLAMIYIRVGVAFKCHDILQWMLDKCFVDQDWTGKTGISFTNIDIGFELKDGKVIDVTANKKAQIVDIPMPIFMSKNTRTYEQIIAYYKTRKLLGIHGEVSITSMEDIEKLSGMFKLYDIFFMERLLTRFKAGLVVRPDISDKLHEMFSGVDRKFGKIVKMTYDDTKTDILYEDSNGNIKSVNSLSAGEQSMLNMMTAQG